MPSVNQEDEFTEVTRKRKKRKAISSPTLPSTLQRTRSSEQSPETPARPKPSTYKNTIPVIFSGIDAKFQNWRSIMGELRQPTDITETDFKEFLDLNKICYAKAERLKSKKTAGSYPSFNSNLATLPKPRLCAMLQELCTRWKNFASPFRFGSASTANVSDIRHKTVSPNKNVSSVVRTIHTKDAQKKKQNSPSVPTVQGLMLHLTRGVPNIKSRHSSNMWSITKKPMPPQ